MDSVNHFFLDFNYFISDRTQIVKYMNYFSEKVFVTSDVSQDHLFPILFCQFLNGMSDIISHPYIVLLTNDTKMFKNISWLNNSIKLQIDLDNIYQRCKQNAMYLNLIKCSTFTFKKRPTTL